MDLSQLTDLERQTLSRLSRDLPFFCSSALKILNKQGVMVPFVFNQAQWHIHNRMEAQKRRTGKVRAIIIKGRQEGCTTYTQARYFHKTLFTPDQSAYILAHQAESTLKIFGMATRFYDNLPEPLQFKRTKDTEKSMTMEQGSTYTVGTAGSAQVGRGMTVQLFHGSEVAFYENTEELSTGLMQTVADLPGTEMILESTANGPGNFFYNKVMQALAQKGDFELIFIPWYWMDEYAVHFELAESQLTDKERQLLETHSVDPVRPMTIANLAWRRKKIIEFEDKEWKFQQEYPCVEENEKVFTSRGLVALKDVQVGDNLYQGVVHEVLDKGQKECVEVTTQMGYKIVCTPDHRILSPRGFIEAQNSLGQEICLAKHKFSNTTARLTFPMAKGFHVAADVTPDFARLMGYFMGDGCIHAAGFSFVCNERDVEQIEDIKRLLRLWSDSPITRRKVGIHGVEIRLNDIRLAEIFDKLGLTELGRQNKRRRKVCVPEFIWRGTEQAAQEFARGVIATDGFVYSNCQQIKIFSKKQEFAQELQLLFTALGYKTQVRGADKKAGNGKTYIGYEITLHCEAARRFRDEVGFLTQWQDDHAVERQKGYRNKPGRGNFTDVVIKVKPVGLRRVFDLCVPVSDRFNAGGITVHNCNVQEAFIHAEERFFDLKQLYAARARVPKINRDKPLIIGIDQGRTGDDTEIARRQANVVFPLETIPSDDGQERDMRLAGRVARIIETEQPDQVFIDTTNEHGALDRLHELGYKRIVKGVHFGSGATDPQRHRNKRTEMHIEFRDWLANEDSSIPDDQKFIAECGAIPKEKETSNNLQYLESKDKIKAELGWSPNKLDAVVLTFAYPVRKRTMTEGSIAQRPQSKIKKAGLHPQMSTMKGVRG